MGNEVITINDVEKMARAISTSKLFGAMNIEQAMALMLIAQAEGRHPALAARDYDIIQGRPAKKSEAMLRDFLESGGKVEWHKLDDKIADATFSHPAGGTVRISWTMERATVAGFGAKDMYKKFPRQMLRSRVVSEGVRTVCPMATSGMYVPEEVQDFSPKEKDITPLSSKSVAAYEYEQLPAAKKTSLEEVCSEIVATFHDGGADEAYDMYVMAKDNLELIEEQAAMKALLPAPVRTAFGKVVAARKAAENNPPLPTEVPL